MSKQDFPQEGLIDRVEPEIRDRILAGELLIEPGQRPEKPVLKDAATGRFIKGSGRPVNANDPAITGKVSAYKQTKSFTEWFDAFIPAVAEDNPDAIISLQELIETAARVSRGEDVEIECSNCKSKNWYAIKPNAKLLSFLIERRVGKAKETQDINLRSESIIQLLQDPRPIGVVEVITMTPEERIERRRQIEEA